MADQKEERKPFCLNFSKKKFEDKYDLTNYRRIAGGSGDGYTMELFTVQDAKTKEYYAAKEVCCSQDYFLDVVWKEINAIINLREHENDHVIKYYEAFLYEDLRGDRIKVEKQVAIIIMELGEYTLYDKISKGLEEDDAYKKMKQALLGLEFLKKNNIYHRDIKPHNFIIKNDVLKFIDLDVAKITQVDKTQKITDKVGTPIYMEAKLRYLQVNERDENYYYNVEKGDLYSLGLTFFQLCLRMNSTDYYNFKKRMDCYQDQGQIGKYNSLLNGKLKKIKNEKLREILENVLTFSPKNRWDLTKCLMESFKLQIEINSREDFEEFEEKYSFGPQEVKFQSRSIELKMKSEFKQVFNISQTLKDKFECVYELSFDFSESQILPNQVAVLVDQMKLFPCLVSFKLGLEKNKVGKKEIEIVMESLKSVSFVRYLELNLRYNLIGDSEIDKIGEALEKFRSLKSFNIYLTENQINVDGGIRLGQIIEKFQGLVSLDLRVAYNKIGCQGVTQIANALKSLPGLTYLNLGLGNNQIQMNGVKSIEYALQFLPDLRILFLSLDNNQIENGGAESISQGIRKLPELSSLELYLNNNQISNGGAESISQGIRKLPELSSLSLSLNDNLILNGGADSLSQGFISLSSLTYLLLYLYDNKIKIQGVESIVQGLRKLPVLTTLSLDLEKNEMEEKDIQVMKQKIGELNIPDNQFWL